MAHVWDGFELKLTFRRCVGPDFLPKWDDLLSLIKTCPFGGVNDEPQWLLELSGVYSTKSFYQLINFGGISATFWKLLWKIPIPMKFHVFI